MFLVLDDDLSRGSIHDHMYATTHTPVSRKKPRYPGDIKPSHAITPESTRKNILYLKKFLAAKDRTIRALNKRLSRKTKRINNLLDAFKLAKQVFIVNNDSAKQITVSRIK